MDLVKVIRKVQRKKAERERGQNQAVCFLCGKQAVLLTVRQAAEYCGTTSDEILQSVQKKMRSDVAVFRPSNGVWFILRSSTNEFQAV